MLSRPGLGMWFAVFPNLRNDDRAGNRGRARHRFVLRGAAIERKYA